MYAFPEDGLFCPKKQNHTASVNALVERHASFLYFRERMEQSQEGLSQQESLLLKVSIPPRYPESWPHI